MAENTKYLKYDADSMVSYLRSTISKSGRFTDQLYDGSNISIMIETLAALFEVIMYQQNFQAAEATFTSVNAYENMVKLLSVIGYKPRLCVSSMVVANLTGNINLSILNNSLNSLQISSTFGELLNNIESYMKYITQAKILTRDLSLSDATNSLQYAVTNETLCYPQLKYDDQSTIFYYYKSNGRAGILQYLINLWGPTMTEDGVKKLYEVNEYSTISTILFGIDATGKEIDTGFDQISDLYIVNEEDVIECDFITSSNPDKNYVTFTNGQWYSYFVTNTTTGMALEEYVIDINVEKTLPANGTLYAIICDTNKNLNNNGINEFINDCEIWTGVRNLRDYTSSDKVFSYGVNTEKTITIQFGDGIYGQQLDSNKQIVLYYIKSDGAEAAIAKGNFSVNASLFSNAVIETSNASITQNLGESYANSVNNKFYYGNLVTEQVSSSLITSTIISKLLVSGSSADSESTNDVLPKIILYANILDNASSFYDLESVQYMKTWAPMYNRTNNRVVTRNDLKVFMETEFSDSIYDVAIMNNYDYMANFYSWLYKHNKLSKTIRTYGYKFADACDFNNIYIWVKGFTRFPINEFYKKTIEYNLLNKKPLTAEPVILDTFNTSFYPYVGNLEDDIEWLVKCMEYYKFTGNTAAENRLKSLFDKDNDGNIKMTINNKLIDYILSDASESKEIKIQLDIYRDTNTVTNIASIANDVSSIITNFFDVKNHKLGENFNSTGLNSELYKIKGINKISTNKLYNISIYNALPFVNTYYFDESTDSRSDKITYKVPIKYNASVNDKKQSIGTSLLQFVVFNNGTEVDVNSDTYKNAYNSITWFKRNLITGELQYIKYIKTADNKFMVSDTEYSLQTYDLNSNTYYNQSFYVYGNPITDKSTTDSNSPFTTEKDKEIDPFICFYNMQTDVNNFYSNKISIYAEIESPTGVLYKTNITTVELIGIDNQSNAGDENTDRCNSYSISSVLDTYTSQFFTNQNSNKAVWESKTSTSMLSLAKWNSKILDGVDFETLGSSVYKLEDFCFPILHKPITLSTISIMDDNLDTSIDIEY